MATTCSRSNWGEMGKFLESVDVQRPIYSRTLNAENLKQVLPTALLLWLCNIAPGTWPSWLWFQLFLHNHWRCGTDNIFHETRKNHGCFHLTYSQSCLQLDQRDWCSVRGPDLNSLWSSDAIWQHRTGSTLAQVMACCLTAPRHYQNQCWLIISKVQGHSSESNFTRDTSAIYHWSLLVNYLSQISFKSPRAMSQWVDIQIKWDFRPLSSLVVGLPAEIQPTWLCERQLGLPSKLYYKTPWYAIKLLITLIKCSWSIACRRCSNYIFILDLKTGFNGLGKDNCKTRRESFKFCDLVCLILEILR